jgi:AcrR family transcriptional regulator
VAAGVNLAAVNYYFGGKEGLFLEVVRQRVRPLNEARLSELAQAAEAAGGKPPPLEVILSILVGPVLDAHRTPARGGAAVVRIHARCLSEAIPPFLGPELTGEFQQTLSRFAQAIRRHVPHLSPAAFLWRFTFVVGALQHSLANLHEMSGLTRGICPNNDYDNMARQFISFAANALRAPSVPDEGGQKMA